jgi:hypothetical protein
VGWVEVLAFDEELEPALLLGLHLGGGELGQLEQRNAAVGDQGAAGGVAEAVAVRMAGYVGQQGLAQQPDPAWRSIITLGLQEILSVLNGYTSPVARKMIA